MQGYRAGLAGWDAGQGTGHPAIYTVGYPMPGARQSILPVLGPVVGGVPGRAVLYRHPVDHWRVPVHHPVCHTRSIAAGTKEVTALLWFLF